ncbi:pumilio domain-containing protein C6G9.14-like [Primulina eburnea]|uniref:pumilio domain-containing protein C6G9.14-like n=1 Tax=Primulina eburnea TaxID=1245227 RepID=UPI003C6C4852
MSTENLFNSLQYFPDLTMQESRHQPPSPAVSTTGNRHLHPEIEPFYPREYWSRSSALRESVGAGLVPSGNMPENHLPPSRTTGPAARNHPLQPDVFYPDYYRRQNLAPSDNGAIYSQPVPARNNLLRQPRRDPFFPGGESFRGPPLTDCGRVSPSFPVEFSLEAEFARLKFLEGREQPGLSEPLSVYGRAAHEGLNSSSLNWLRGNEIPPPLSLGDLQALRASAAAEGFKLPQVYPDFEDRFLIPDSYWVNRDSNRIKNILGGVNSYNRGMNINGYKPRNGFNFSKHVPISITGVNSSSLASSIPSPRNGYGHGSTQSVTCSSVEDLKGGVFLEAMDQHGCRLLRQKLDEGRPEDVLMIFSELKDRIHTLMCDRFGNSVIQKLFEVCDEEQVSQLVSLMTADEELLIAVCLDPEGSQSMQKFVQCLVAPELVSHMLSIFEHITIRLVNNHIGSGVIQHCISIFPAEETEKILNVIADNCFQIATNRSGCCLLQVFITKDSPLESQLHILAEIVSNIHELSKNQFGNYVVQHVIGLEIPNVIKGMVAGLRGNFVSLSMDKYGSNVVERLMKVSQEIYAPQIINEITSSPSFLNVVLDPYGNYVVQSAKRYATGATRKTLNNLILQHFDDLHNHLYGKNVLLNKVKTRHSI